jgi:phosphohistidine phosphatase
LTKTLILVRHAKSSWDDPRLADDRRPLSGRGNRQAPKIGAWLERAGLLPDAILCSTAVRTRETLAHLTAAWQSAPPATFTDALYMPAADQLIATVRRHARDNGSAARLMIVGHNPSLQAAALDLIGEGDAADRSAIASKLPTSAVVAIGFADWPALKAGAGTLRRFMTPARLP